MKSILFIVNGTGLGNATRCDSIIEQLGHVENIYICCANNSYDYFSQKKQRNLKLIKNVGFSYAKNKSGSISYFKTLLNLYSFVFLLLNNSRRILWLIRDKKIDLVFSDSDYSFVIVKFFSKCPFVAINNAAYVMKNAPLAFPWLFKTLPSLFIEFLDFLVHLIFADLIFCPTFENHYAKWGKVIFTPPLVRKKFYLIKNKKISNAVTVLPSGFLTTDKRIESIIARLPEDKLVYAPNDFHMNKKCSIYDRLDDTSNLFVKSNTIICNGGMSSLSEVLVTGVSAFVLPIKNHFEQLVNAALISKKVPNCSVILDLDQACKSILEMPHQEMCSENYQNASRFIVKIINRRYIRFNANKNKEWTNNQRR